MRQIVDDALFSAIEITWIHDDEVRDKVAHLLRTSGMEVVYLAGIPMQLRKVNLSSVSEETRRRAVAEIKPLIDEACTLGACLFLVGSGPDPGPAHRDVAKAQLVRSLGELCAYARQISGERLTITLENFDRDVDKRYLLGPTREAVEVAQMVRKANTNFGLTIDESHLCQLGENPADEVPGAIDVIVYVHLANCVLDNDLPGYGDQHPRFGVPGSEVGVEEMCSFLSVLGQAGYFEKSPPTRLPVVSLEVRPQHGEETATVIANAKRTFMQAWAQCGLK